MNALQRIFENYKIKPWMITIGGFFWVNFYRMKLIFTVVFCILNSKNGEFELAQLIKSLMVE